MKKNKKGRKNENISCQKKNSMSIFLYKISKLGHVNFTLHFEAIFSFFSCSIKYYGFYIFSRIFYIVNGSRKWDEKIK